jgi:hypothetical protein
MLDWFLCASCYCSALFYVKSVIVEPVVKLQILFIVLHIG